jgi:hypothetical protein
MLSQQIADAVESARSGRALDDIARLVWRALAEGHLDDDTAGRLAGQLEARRVLCRSGGVLRTERPPTARREPVQRSPDRQRSIERRRRLAAAGPLPPALASNFTLSQLAVLRVVADEVRTHGRCFRSLNELAARAGVCRRTAQGALREAARLGLVHIQERRRTAWMNDPNVVSVVSPEWRTWLRLSRPDIRMQKSSEHGQQVYIRRATSPAGDATESSRRALIGSAGRPPGQVFSRR